MGSNPHLASVLVVHVRTMVVETQMANATPTLKQGCLQVDSIQGLVAQGSENGLDEFQIARSFDSVPSQRLRLPGLLEEPRLRPFRRHPWELWMMESTPIQVAECENVERRNSLSVSMPLSCLGLGEVGSILIHKSFVFVWYQTRYLQTCT